MLTSNSTLLMLQLVVEGKVRQELESMLQVGGWVGGLEVVCAALAVIAAAVMGKALE